MIYENCKYVFRYGKPVKFYRQEDGRKGTVVEHEVIIDSKRVEEVLVYTYENGNTMMAVCIIYR